jgi:CO/xanthine dehydrogenase Mo-binding subunit
VLAESFGLPLEKVGFVCPDVGGGFGLRHNLWPEQAHVLWASRRGGRPMKWTNDCCDSFLTDHAGRDLVTTPSLALTRDGASSHLRAALLLAASDATTFVKFNGKSPEKVCGLGQLTFITY